LQLGCSLEACLNFVLQILYNPKDAIRTGAKVIATQQVMP